MSFGFTAKKAEQNGHPAPPISQRGAPAPSPRSPVPAPQRPAGRSIDHAQPSTIGPDVTIIGNLVSKGELQIDGEVQGDLHGTHIVVGERAHIDGGVTGEEVVIRGHVSGSVRGRKVMLQSSSHVEGDIHHESFSIEQGAYFEGKSRRTANPLEGVDRPSGLPTSRES